MCITGLPNLNRKTLKYHRYIKITSYKTSRKTPFKWIVKNIKAMEIIRIITIIILVFIYAVILKVLKFIFSLREAHSFLNGVYYIYIFEFKKSRIF